MRKKIYIILMISSIFLVGCEEEFLEPDHQRLVSMTRVDDFEALLNGAFVGLVPTSYALIAPGIPTILMSDNVYFPSGNIGQSAATLVAAYGWEESIFEPGADPSPWTLPYNNIYTYNTLLNEIDNALDISINTERVETLKAEALVGRAFEHFFLVSAFAQPYTAENATTQPGIPYMEHADITKAVPARETLEKTYERIEADINKALPNLPDLPEIRIRASKIAAYGILARMHLYKQEYDKCLEAVNKALAIKSNYTDYTPIEGGFVYFLRQEDLEDNLYLRSNPEGSINSQVPDELLALYDVNDKRRDMFFWDLANTGTLSFGFIFSSFIDRGITMQELVLTKAEVLARNGQLGEALGILNEFKSKRIVGFNAQNGFTSSDKEEVLGWVLDERRKEFVATTHRFFDMKRLQLEGRIGTITHNLTGGQVATLEEGSPRYTLRIPDVVIGRNPGMEQNP